MADHGKFYWNELMTTDVDGAKAFYADVAGWEFDSMDMADGGTYWVAKVGGEPAGGIMAMPDAVPDGTPPHWRSYVTVDDVDAAVATATENGGTALFEAFDAPGVGRIGGFLDPQGAAISVITPAPQE